MSPPRCERSAPPQPSAGALPAECCCRLWPTVQSAAALRACMELQLCNSRCRQRLSSELGAAGAVGAARLWGRGGRTEGWELLPLCRSWGAGGWWRLGPAWVDGEGWGRGWEGRDGEEKFGHSAAPSWRPPSIRCACAALRPCPAAGTGWAVQTWVNTCRETQSTGKGAPRSSPKGQTPVLTSSLLTQKAPGGANCSTWPTPAAGREQLSLSWLQKYLQQAWKLWASWLQTHLARTVCCSDVPRPTPWGFAGVILTSEPQPSVSGCGGDVGMSPGVSAAHVHHSRKSRQGSIVPLLPWAHPAPPPALLAFFAPEFPPFVKQDVVQPPRTALLWELWAKVCCERCEQAGRIKCCRCVGEPLSRKPGKRRDVSLGGS